MLTTEKQNRTIYQQKQKQYEEIKRDIGTDEDDRKIEQNDRSIETKIDMKNKNKKEIQEQMKTTEKQNRTINQQKQKQI